MSGPRSAEVQVPFSIKGVCCHELVSAWPGLAQQPTGHEVTS